MHKFVNKKLCFIVKPQAKQCIWTMWVRPWEPLCIAIQIWDESENRVAATLYHVLLGGFYILVWNLGNEEKRERDARLNFSFFPYLSFLSWLSFTASCWRKPRLGWTSLVKTQSAHRHKKKDWKFHQDQPAVPHILECLGGAVVFLDHEVSSSNCSTATVSHVAAGPWSQWGIMMIMLVIMQYVWRD